MGILGLEVEDLVDELSDGRIKEQNPRKVDKIAIHRVGWDLEHGINLGNTANEIGRHFIGDGRMDVAKATGGEMPYTFWVNFDKDASISQTLAVWDIGRHARRFNNNTAIGIAVVCDARFKSPSLAQIRSLRTLCTALCFLLGISPDRIFRHDELPGGSRDPNKECPGKFLKVEVIRSDVWNHLIAYRRKLIEWSGMRALG